MPITSFIARDVEEIWNAYVFLIGEAIQLNEADGDMWLGETLNSLPLGNLN